MTEPRSFLRVTLGAGLAIAAATASPAQTASGIEDEIAFARGLASKWSFVDLAEEVIRGVSASRMEDEQEASLALLRCEIYSIGARNERDPVKRNDLFEQALSCLDGYIQDNPYAVNKADAEQAFVSTSQVYARSLELALADAIGEEAAALQERRLAVLSAAVLRAQALVESLSAIPKDDRTEKQEAQRLELWLNRGEMYAAMSAAQKGDPYMRETAIKVLEDLIFEAGEGTPYNLRAYKALGDVYFGNGEFAEAAALYDGVADVVIPFDPARRESELEWSTNLEPAMKQRRFLFVELSMPGILSAYANAGDTEKARSRALYFWNLYRKEGLDLSVYGQQALLDIAKIMLDSDGYLGGDLSTGDAEWFATEEEMAAKYRQRRLQTTTTDFALQLANQVSAAAASAATTTAAGKLIAEISKRPGVQISAAQMLDAATAKYRDDDFEGAGRAIDELLVRLDSLEPAERIEYGAKVYHLLGNVLNKSGRELEAAMAFREAALNWSDPEIDETNAKRYQFLISRYARAAGDDPVLKELLTEAENVVASKGPEASGDAVKFVRGQRAQAAEKWEEAIRHYSELPRTAQDYEVAYVNIGVCQFRGGEPAEALARFNEYLDVVRVDPELATESPTMLTRRKTASATAEFYRGYISHLLADARYKKSQDTSGYEKVLEYFVGFDQRYPEQSSFGAIAKKQVVDSYAKLDRAKDARRALDEMVERYPDADSTSSAATSLAVTLGDRIKSLEEAKAEKAAIDEVRRDLAEVLAISNRISASPKLANLENEAVLWFGLGEWERAKAVYARIINKHGEDPDPQMQLKMRRFIPDLAYCMLQLREVNDAKALLDPFVRSEAVTMDAMRYYGMAVSGWLEGGKSGVTWVPGASGTEEEFTFLSEKQRAIQASQTAWTSCQWYEDKLAEMLTFYAWSKVDARKLETAKRMIEEVVTFLLNDAQFATVDQYCSTDEETTPEMKARLGDGTLQARYQWLATNVR